jgi:hypothetical protein
VDDVVKLNDTPRSRQVLPEDIAHSSFSLFTDSGQVAHGADMGVCPKDRPKAIGGAVLSLECIECWYRCCRHLLRRTSDDPERPISGAALGDRPTGTAGYPSRLSLRIIDSSFCLSNASSPAVVLLVTLMG